MTCPVSGFNFPISSPSSYIRKPQYVHNDILRQKIDGGQGGIIFIDYKYTYEYNVQLFVQFLSYPQGHVVDINKMISFLSGENGSGIRHP